jgi:hypothetical protein
VSSPERALLSLDLEDVARARIQRLTEDDARESCQAFFTETRESLLQRVRNVSGEEIHVLVEELRESRFALEARSQIDAGDACKRELLENFVATLAPFAVAPPPPPVKEKKPAPSRAKKEPTAKTVVLVTPWDDAKEKLAALEETHAPLAAEWGALTRELGQIDAAGVLAKLRLCQERIAEMNADIEELRLLKQALYRDFGTDQPGKIAGKLGLPKSEVELRLELEAVQSARAQAEARLAAIESEFGEAHPIKMMRSIRRLRDDITARDKDQAQFVSERSILAREFHGLDAARIVAQNRSLKERLAETLEANQSLDAELVGLRADREKLRSELGCESIDDVISRYSHQNSGEMSLRDLEDLLGDAESALSSLAL